MAVLANEENGVPSQYESKNKSSYHDWDQQRDIIVGHIKILRRCRNCAKIIKQAPWPSGAEESYGPRPRAKSAKRSEIL
jgi:hypothetical protein